MRREGLEGEVAQLREVLVGEAAGLLEAAQEALEASPGGMGEAEQVVRAGLRRVGGAILGAAVRLLGKGYDGSRKGCVCGSQRKYVADRRRQVVSLVGEFELERAYYWCANCGSGQAPLDEQLGIAGTDFSPGVRQAIGLLGARLPFGEGRAALGEVSGIWVSKRTHEEIAEGIGRSLLAPLEELMGVSNAQPRGEHSLPAPEDVPLRACPAADEQLYIAVDGTMAPTLSGWREVKLGAVFHAGLSERHEPERRRTRYFGDLTDAESFGRDIYRQACAMGLAYDRRLVVLGDGAAWIWNQAQLHPSAGRRRGDRFPGAIQVVDWYHASERLWTVAKACLGELDPRTVVWVRQAESLLARDRLRALLVKLKRLRPRSRQNKQLVAQPIGYFTSNAPRMRYRHFRNMGLFISSGVIEAGALAPSSSGIG